MDQNVDWDGGWVIDTIFSLLSSPHGQKFSFVSSLRALNCLGLDSLGWLGKLRFTGWISKVSFSTHI